MRTRRNQSVVSLAFEVSGIGLAALLVTALGAGACAGRQHPVTHTERAESAGDMTRAMTAEPRTDVLQFDNLSTVWVDVYLVSPSGQPQWRLGRVLPGIHAVLRVPESAIERTAGFVQLAVIPGSQVSAEASRDPRAVVATQPMSEMLSQRWTFRQPTGPALRLQATPLSWAELRRP